jgi:Sulfotransferase domain
MVLRYEDLHEDRLLALEKVAAFSGIEASRGTIEVAADRGDFDAMLRDEQRHGAEAYPWKPGRGPRFLRQGRVDGWRDELPGESARSIEEQMGHTMQTLGYPVGSIR